jgi:hypothetical protein
MPEHMFMKLSMYIMAPDLISAECFINSSHQSVCLYVYPSTFARQGLSKNITEATNTTIEELLDTFFVWSTYQRKVGDYFFPEFPVCYLTRVVDFPILKMFSSLSLNSSVSIVTGYGLDS